MVGGRVRVTYDYLPRNVTFLERFNVESGVQYDNVRHTSAYVGFSFRFGVRQGRTMSGFARHLSDLIRRDPDIVVTSERVTQNTLHQQNEIRGGVEEESGFYELSKAALWERGLADYGIEQLPETITFTEFEHLLAQRFRKIALQTHPDKVGGNGRDYQYYSEIKELLIRLSKMKLKIRLPANATVTDPVKYVTPWTPKYFLGSYAEIREEEFLQDAPVKGDTFVLVPKTLYERKRTPTQYVKLIPYGRERKQYRTSISTGLNRLDQQFPASEFRVLSSGECLLSNVRTQNQVTLFVPALTSTHNNLFGAFKYVGRFLENQGTLETQRTLTLDARRQMKNLGRLVAGETLRINAEQVINAKEILAYADLSIISHHFHNDEIIFSTSITKIIIDQTSNGGLIWGKEIYLNSESNYEGLGFFGQVVKLYSPQNVTLKTILSDETSIEAEGEIFVKRHRGKVLSLKGKTVTLETINFNDPLLPASLLEFRTSFERLGLLEDLEIVNQVGGVFEHRGGLLELSGNFTYVGDTFRNNGTIKIGGTTQLAVQRLENYQTFLSKQDCLIELSGFFYNRGILESGGTLKVLGEGYVHNDHGTLIGDQVLLHLLGADATGHSYRQTGTARLSSKHDLTLLALHHLYFGYYREDLGVEKVLLPPQSMLRLINSKGKGLIVRNPGSIYLPGEPGFRYQASTVQAGGNLNIASEGAIVLEGCNVESVGNLTISGQNVTKNKLSGSYVRRREWGVVGQQRGKHRKRMFGPRGSEDVYGWRDNRVNVDLDVKVISYRGDVHLESTTDLKISGDIAAYGKIRLRASDLWLTAIERYTDRGGRGLGDDLAYQMDQTALQMLMADANEVPEDLQGALVATVNAENYFGSKVYEGARLLGRGGIEIEVTRNLLMESPLIASLADVSLRSLKGNIYGEVLFSDYLDHLVLEGEIQAISGRRGMMMALQRLLLSAPEGEIKLAGYYLKAETLNLIAEAIELTGAQHTVIQTTFEHQSKWFSHTNVRRWQSHHVAFLTELQLEGTQISVQDLEIESEELILREYIVEHYYREERKSKGIKLPGIYGTAITSGPHFGKNFVDNVPLLSRINGIAHQQGMTDLAPTIKFGVELLDILSSGQGVAELLKGQLGINDYFLPKGIGFYREKQLTEERFQSGYMTQLSGSDRITINGKTIQIEGSVLLSEHGEIYFTCQEFRHYPSRLQYSQISKVQRQEYGITIDHGVGIDFGLDYDQNEAWRNYLQHGAILGQEVKLEVTNEAIVNSPIEGDRVKILAGNLLVESLTEAGANKNYHRGYKLGVSVGKEGISPSGGFNYGKGKGSRRWVEVPAVIKGEALYVEVGGKLSLFGGWLIGKETEVKAEEIALQNVEEHDRYHYNSVGFNLNSLKDLYLGKYAKSLVKGWGDLAHQRRNQDGVLHPTITGLSEEDAKQIQATAENGHLLNQDEAKLIEVGDLEEKKYSIAVPLINREELKHRWNRYLEQFKKETSAPSTITEEVLETTLQKENAVEQKLTPIKEEWSLINELFQEFIERVIEQGN